MNFEKVSINQFLKDSNEICQKNSKELLKIYENIELPQRSTKGSAGYDFYLPYDISIAPGESIFIPTGIRVKMPDNVVLLIFPRSGIGSKYRIQLANTVGIIDSDYFYSLNEGHILIKITNDNKENKNFYLKQGKGFVQGIFMPYLICDDDKTEKSRIGGFGSTDIKNT